MPDPITPASILNWQQMTGTALTQRERKTIFALDSAFRAEVGTERRDAMVRMQNSA